MKWDNTDWLILVEAALLAIALLIVLSGCTGLPINSNATNPVISPEITGSDNQVNTLTTSKTKQESNQLKAGDGSENQVFNGINNQQLAAMICFMVFIVLLIFLVKLEILTLSAWVIFATAIGLMGFGIFLIFSGGEM